MVGRKYENSGIAKDGAEIGHRRGQMAQVPKFAVIIGGSFRRRQLRHVRPRLQPAHAVDVGRIHTVGVAMGGGRQAASVLSTIKRPGATWHTPAFDDASWPEGPAQLGYGDGDEATVVGYGPDSFEPVRDHVFPHGIHRQ